MQSTPKIVSVVVVLGLVVIAGLSGYAAAGATATPMTKIGGLTYLPQARVICFSPYGDVYDDGGEYPAIPLTISKPGSGAVIIRAEIPARDYSLHPYWTQCVRLPALSKVVSKPGSEYRWCFYQSGTDAGRACITRPVDQGWRV